MSVQSLAPTTAVTALRISGAMVAAGFSTFAMMNAVQPLMPIFSQQFAISAASASLSLSVTIGALALAMLVSAGLSDRFGRKPVMVASLWLSSLTMVLTGLASDWTSLLVLRALGGLAMAGVPAIAITYIAEEVPADRRIRMNGIYVAGAALGGMAGRLLAGSLVAPFGWHGAMIITGALGLVTALAFGALLPASRNFAPERSGWRAQARAFLPPLRDPVQRRLSLIGFLLMGALVSTYNYLGYRLSAPPFALSPALIGSLFLFYVTGMFSASASGALAARVGSEWALRLSTCGAGLGLLLTLAGNLLLILSGLVIFTMGFFAAHTLASGATARQSPRTRTQAATLYLLCYYLGGAVLGWLSGYIWEGLGWTGTCLALTLVLATVIALVPPRAAEP